MTNPIFAQTFSDVWTTAPFGRRCKPSKRACHGRLTLQACIWNRGNRVQNGHLAVLAWLHGTLADQRAVVGETSGAALHSSLVGPKDQVSVA
ncbi:uncharacterized protein ACBT44_003525 isoform 3-T11 [Syngnathus typhle]